MPRDAAQVTHLAIQMPDGAIRRFSLGAHAPALSPEDVERIHLLWVEAVKAVGPEVHHRDVVSAALGAGALGAKLAGAGQGGTIIALHPDPDRLGDALMAAGARRLFTPTPVEGVRYERADG